MELFATKLTYRFSIYNGQHIFILKGTQVGDKTSFKLFEARNWVLEPVDHIIGYSDENGCYFEETLNGITGCAQRNQPVKAVKEILTQLY